MLASRMLGVFCKPILAILLQRKFWLLACLHLACWLCFVSPSLVVFCKPILAILWQREHQTIINPSLQYCYKENWSLACMHLACWLCFVNPSLQYCYKEKIRRSSMHLACWLCFVNPSLQYCYKESVVWLLACSPLNPRISIYRFYLQTAFRARMRIFKSGI